MRRNNLNENRAEILVYVHNNWRMLIHYCDQACDDISNLYWDNNPKEDTLEDGALHLEEL